MASQKSTNKKQRTKLEQQQEQRFGDTMIDEVILIIIAVVSIVVLISLLTKKMGILGGLLGNTLKGLLGISSILLPLSIIAYCCWLLMSEEKENREVRIGGAALFLVAVSALAHVIHPVEVSVLSSLADTLKAYYQEGAFDNGGLIGGILGGGIARAFGKIGSGIIWGAVLLISLIMVTGKSFFKGISNVNIYQKDKRKQYPEKKEKLQVLPKKETYIEQPAKKAVKHSKAQQKLVQSKPVPQKPQYKMQPKQTIKKKKHKKSDFNILLYADEGYNENRQEVPWIEETVFKSKKQKEVPLEVMPKTPIIFDYGKSEEQITEEMIQSPIADEKEDFIMEKGNRILEENEQQTYNDTEQTISYSQHFDTYQKEVTDESFLERQEDVISSEQPNHTIDNAVRYMIFQEGEEPPLQEEEIEQKDTENTILEKQEQWVEVENNVEDMQSLKSDTEDIADVLALLNSIEFEEEPVELEENTTEDIMDIIADWAEDEEDIPQSNGLALLFAEEESQPIPKEELSQQMTEENEEDTCFVPSQQLLQKNAIEQKKEAMQTNDSQKKTLETEKNQQQQETVFKQEKKYIFPPLDLLAKNQAVQSGDSKTEMLMNAKKLEATLKSFGVDAKVIQINKGPTVTRYELSPSQGVKVSKIVNLADDIALNLAASGIRIEAPIPGKAAVGIEVPNKEAQSVFLRSVLESEAFQKFPSKLAFALGEDITGEPIVTDIAKMPHLLIAGATGSGKSVCINTLITSILYKADPKEVKLLLVDPKVVELSVYNGIPHLLIPVVTDPKKASAALNWAVREMLERYNDFAENGVRDIKGYNALKKEQKEEEQIMPQIVIIIDELADLMMAAPGEVEDSICRLAQMARAAGMHLIIATQRPSVDVITGVIKANIPSRLAFAVSSGIDSRTILDAVGAEKLLGKGDMLFCPQGTNKPVRIQGAFLSDKEVEKIVNFVKQDTLFEYDKEMIDKITAIPKVSNGGENIDEFFDQAVDLVVEKEKASVSMLQRQFRIGYNRAARLMDSLQQQGIVGPEEGSKPRKVLLTKQEWEEMKGNVD